MNIFRALKHSLSKNCIPLHINHLPLFQAITYGPLWRWQPALYSTKESSKESLLVPAKDIVNCPPQTLLTIQSPIPDLSTLKRFLVRGKAIVIVYKTGISNLWNNQKAVRKLRKKYNFKTVDEPRQRDIKRCMDTKNRHDLVRAL